MPEINGYKVLPIRLTENSTNSHVAYVREHFIRQVDPNKPKGRTLFLLNIPPYVSEHNLKTCFSKIGEVTSVRFSEQPGREESKKWEQPCPFTLNRIPCVFKVAFVVFKNTDSVSKALKLDSIDLFDESGNTLVVSGIQKWKKDYASSFLKDKKIQPIIDEYMEAYDKREKKKLQDERNSAADNDGWVTVGKQGRNSGFEQKESVVNRLEEKIERGRKNRELKNFYTFQIREAKMQNVVSLRKKFEEDKSKIEILKKKRRFKPF
ncbi:ribosomal RNA-processing protein 7 homolog A [Episyrphus balteatus]|uniref:ribosomal RNA-processing protein 7 homolog A n=1 Tax=Episyrphus balteatus TaxID=286459 RepID=UPI002486BD47|nr:ribosomal RNA-processing protein 7 homolog A [Episyrphus balteatus]